MPEDGGKTGFIDNQLTYEALSEPMKAKVEGLHVIQSWDRAEAYLARNRGYRIGGDKEMVVGKFKDMIYPLVFAHPHHRGEDPQHHPAIRRRDHRDAGSGR